MLLHSTLEVPDLTLELYSTQAGLVAIGLCSSSRSGLERWLGRFYDGARIYPAESGHELYRRQLIEYFEGRRTVFEFPLELRGSPFQKEVWEAVARIPHGCTSSYGEIAALVGRPGASRAVGMANGANPLPIVVPCHRVIGADGTLTGYGGGLALKTRLLTLEGILSTGRGTGCTDAPVLECSRMDSHGIAAGIIRPGPKRRDSECP